MTPLCSGQGKMLDWLLKTECTVEGGAKNTLTILASFFWGEAMNLTLPSSDKKQVLPGGIAPEDKFLYYILPSKQIFQVNAAIISF